MTRIVAWCLGFMKWVSEDPSYVTGGEPEYPQELFSAVDLLFLQFLGASCTQSKVSMVSFGRISPNSFLYSILLVVVIIVTVVIIMVILIVVVVAIFGVVSVSYVGGFFQSLSLGDHIGWFYSVRRYDVCHSTNKASLVRVPVANVTLSSSAHLLRENTNLVRSNQRMRNFLWNNVPIGIVSANAMVQLVLPERTVIPSEMSCWMTAKSYGWCNQDANALLGGILSTQDNA
ncbi:hypothetical protein Tco_1446343 [Tanacetum coccineum]